MIWILWYMIAGFITCLLCTVVYGPGEVGDLLAGMFLWPIMVIGIVIAYIKRLKN